MLAPRTEPLHRLDGGVGDSGKRTAPAGMGGADDDGLMVGKQHGRAVRGEDTEQQVGRVGDHRVGARAPILRPGFLGDHDVGRMDLVDCRKLGAWQKRCDGETAVAGDRLAIVVAAVSDVEARAFADRNPAAPAEEAVGQAAQADRAGDLDAQSAFLMMISSSAWFPTMNA